MDMEIVDLVTYICAALGGVLLLLCIILAAIFLYSACRKNLCPGSSNRQYVIVPTDQEGQNGSIVLRKFSTEDLEKNGIVSSSISFEDEADSKLFSKNVPPVKKKMLWKQKKKSYQQQIIFKKEDEDIQFKDEELDVPKERLFKSKLKAKRRSKSDWDLYDSQDEESVGLVKNFKTQESQYFDALDTIQEEVNDSEEDSLDDLDEAATLMITDDEWEDVIEEGDEEVGKKVTREQRKKKHHHSAVIQRRINALKVLQLQQKAMEAKFYVALYELEGKQCIRPKQSLYEKRYDIINQKNEHGEPGIDGFWLQAMDNCENLKSIVQLHDRPILKHLIDIRITTSPTDRSDSMGFRLEFHFSQNEYFENDILYKDYALRCEPDLADPWSFEGPEVCNCKGCKILWYKGKNASLRPVRKIKEGQIVTKWAKRNSFFNFFTPPKMTREAMLDPAKRTLFDAHFQIGLFLKETFISNATSFYLNFKDKKAASTADIKKKPNQVTSGRKTPIPKPSGRTESTRGSLVIESSSPTKIERKPGLVANGQVPHQQVQEEDSKSAIIEVLPPPAADPIVGRYRLLKTENFDEFMKKLGVGLVKRKLANSVSPMNVIIVNDDGSYTVRTESTVRTTELNFNLGVPFKEDTLDGRVTDTTATRVGNILTLDQQGDKSRGDLDSKQIRDFNGDKMLMSLVVQDVVCHRYYEKVKED